MNVFDLVEGQLSVYLSVTDYVWMALMSFWENFLGALQNKILVSIYYYYSP